MHQLNPTTETSYQKSIQIPTKVLIKALHVFCMYLSYACCNRCYQHKNKEICYSVLRCNLFVVEASKHRSLWVLFMLSKPASCTSFKSQLNRASKLKFKKWFISKYGNGGQKKLNWLLIYKWTSWTFNTISTVLKRPPSKKYERKALFFCTICKKVVRFL